jgi:alkaline phosphatase
MWIFSASYAQGQGNVDHVDPTGRRNPRGMDYMDSKFRQPAAVPMDEGTHSGEDVGVYANGPWAHVGFQVFKLIKVNFFVN